ncbi:hypothetical protein [Psychrobacter sp. DM8]|uniref:hypothetical protein n=1 Tax=Psychrobacter sp. DM8 TaxID=3440636 RepID=UPI003F4F8BE4
MTVITLKKPRSIKRHFSLSYYNTFSIAIICPLFLSACGHDDYSNDIQDPAVITEQSVTEQNIKEIEENIKNSYARLAAKHSDICPKLLQKNVDDETIVRTAEIMVYDYCEYYLYPDVGQSIDVDINTDKIETMLVVPSVHNFANGPYKVTSYDKHIIRLNYIGVKYKPKRLEYDLTMVIKD